MTNNEPRMKPKSQAFFPAAGGGLAMTFALALPVVFGAVGLVSDYAMMTKVRGELQAAADAAAIAGAYEVPLAQKDAQQVVSVVKSFASYALVKNSGATESDLLGENLTVSAEVIDDFSAVRVNISEQWTPFFAHFLSSDVTPVNVTATARFVGRNNICVLGLAPKGTAVTLDTDARLTGNNCGVFSNSTGANSLAANSGVKLKAAIVCSSGGVVISGTAMVDPSPITDCPPIEDPLLKRQPPGVGACDHQGLAITNETRTLDPGVYCGGLVIDGASNITLNPGVYVVKDGGLKVMGNAVFSGEGVGFYITGAATGTNFGLNSHISLSAPKTGPLAGLLVFEDRSLATSLNHRITSDDARTLIGTIYLPKGTLLVDAKNPVADQSAYTAIVARLIKLNSGPNLVLNSNYEATDVPVPAGISGSSQVVLSN